MVAFLCDLKGMTIVGMTGLMTFPEDPLRVMIFKGDDGSYRKVSATTFLGDSFMMWVSGNKFWY